MEGGEAEVEDADEDGGEEGEEEAQMADNQAATASPTTP